MCCYQCKKELSKLDEAVHDQQCDCKEGSAMRYVHDTCLSANMIQMGIVNEKHVLDARRCAFCNQERQFSPTERGYAVFELVLHQMTFSRLFLKMNLVMLVIPFLCQLYSHGALALLFDVPVIVGMRYMEHTMLQKLCQRRDHPVLYRSWAQFILYCQLQFVELCHLGVLLCLISGFGVAFYHATGELLGSAILTTMAHVVYANVVGFHMYISIGAMTRGAASVH